MLLSIGMIVKNEKKYLDRCLAAIKPILDNVDSELIIADTGSSDDTVDIAKRYTDKVFTFEWVNDFAAARNSTLGRASGEWYMFLDADEIFCSCDEIVGFFNSGEYRNYNSATYIIRSLYSSGGSSDFDAHRLTRRLNGTKFEGVVHEQLNTFGEPIKRLADVAEHYGYLSDAGTNNSKFRRNSELLLKKLNEQGDSDPLLFLQLYECFYLHDRETAEKYLDRGITVCENKEHPVMIALYCHKAHLMYFDENYDKTLDICSRYFGMSRRIRPGTLTTDCEMYGFMASSLLHIGRFDEAVSAYTSFFKLYNMKNCGKLKTPDADLLVYYLASRENLSVALYEFLNSCLRSQSASPAARVLSGLNLKNNSFPEPHIKAIGRIIDTLIPMCSDRSEQEILSEKLKELYSSN